MLKSNNRYKIATPSGYEDFLGIRKSEVSILYKFTFSDDSCIRCTTDHKFLTNCGFVSASKITKDMNISGKEIKTIEIVKGNFNVYDPVEVENHNSYFSGEVVSHNCEFLGSSNTLISAKKLSQLTYISPIMTSGDVFVYEHPIPGHVYLASVDTSRGAGIDYSATVMVDITEIPYRLVAKYRNNEIESLVYPTIIYNLCRHYNDAYCLVETNDVGQQVADILLQDLEYENVLMTKTKGKAGQKLNGGAGAGSRFTLGVRTTVPVKRIGCANFKSLVENDKFIVNDYDLLYEMFRFVEHNQKYQAEEGEHDDLVMCCVLFSWLVHQDYFKELSNNDARKNVLDHNRATIDQHMSPFGFIDDVWRDPALDEDSTDPFDLWMPVSGNW